MHAVPSRWGAALSQPQPPCSLRRSHGGGSPTRALPYCAAPCSLQAASVLTGAPHQLRCANPAPATASPLPPAPRPAPRARLTSPGATPRAAPSATPGERRLHGRVPQAGRALASACLLVGPAAARRRSRTAAPPPGPPCAAAAPTGFGSTSTTPPRPAAATPWVAAS